MAASADVIQGPPADAHAATSAFNGPARSIPATSRVLRSCRQVCASSITASPRALRGVGAKKSASAGANCAGRAEGTRLNGGAHHQPDLRTCVKTLPAARNGSSPGATARGSAGCAGLATGVAGRIAVLSIRSRVPRNHRRKVLRLRSSLSRLPLPSPECHIHPGDFGRCESFFMKPDKSRSACWTMGRPT